MPFQSRRHTTGRQKPGIILVLGAILAALPNAGVAQRADLHLNRYMVRNWSAIDGLPVDYVGETRLGPDGTLWVSTFYGLARFDGTSFQTLSNDAVSGWGRSNRIAGFCPDDAGVWFLTAGGDDALYRWDADTEDRVVQYATGINALMCLGDRIAVRSKDEMRLFEGGSWARRFPANETEQLLVDGEYTLWMSGIGRLTRIMRDTAIVYTSAEGIPPDLDDADRNWRSIFSQVAIGGEGTPYLANGEGVYGLRNGRWERIAPLDNQVYGRLTVSDDEGGTIWSLYPDGLTAWRDGQVRRLPLPEAPIDLVKDRIMLYNVQDHLFLILRKDYASQLYAYDAHEHWVPIGLDRYLVKVVNHVAMDRAGVLWMATDQGLLQVVPRRVEAITPDEGLLDPQVYALAPDGEGGVWISVWTKGVQRFHEGQFTALDRTNGLQDNHVKSFHLAPDGSFWIGAQGAVLRVAGGRIVEHLVIDQPATPVPTNVVHVEKTGQMWVATAGGLYRRSGDRLVEAEWAGMPLPARRSIRGMLSSGADSLYLATDLGLYLTLDRRKAERIPLIDSSLRLTSIMEDAAGDRWITTDGAGLLRLHGHRIVRYTAEMGLRRNTLQFVLEDRHGDIWVGLEAEVMRLSRASLDAVMLGRQGRLDVLSLDVEDGIPGGEIMRTRNAAFVAQDGRLWVGTGRGVAIINPDSIATHPPDVALKDVAINGVSVPWEHESRFLPGARNSIHFTLSTRSAAKKRRTEFRFRLMGRDEGWTGTDRQDVLYQRLDPGAYMFEAFAVDKDGRRSEHTVRYPFVIEAEFYRTAWFRAVAALLLVGAIAAAGYRRERRRRMAFAQAQREHRYEERERLSRDLHDDLLNNINIHKKGLELLQQGETLSDTGRTLLDVEIHTMDELMGSLQDTVWYSDPKNDRLDALASRMERWLRRLPTPPRVSLDVRPEEGVPGIPLEEERRRHVFMLFKEAVGNAVKHAACTQIAVSIAYENERFRFAVGDNGVGFDRDGITHGNGLANMEHRARKAGGLLSINSVKGVGTRVEFELELETPA
ncbi:MAG: ATP-binding protein [Rhodothermales bacterium]